MNELQIFMQSVFDPCFIRGTDKLCFTRGTGRGRGLVMELLHKDITEQIIGAAFEVNRVLGYGFLEKVCQRVRVWNGRSSCHQPASSFFGAR